MDPTEIRKFIVQCVSAGMDKRSTIDQAVEQGIERDTAFRIWDSVYEEIFGDRESHGDAYAYAVAELERGVDDTTILSRLEEAGLPAEDAASILGAAHEDEARLVKETEPSTPASLLVALLAGLGAAASGGWLWSKIAVEAGVEHGFVAIAIGLLSGVAVLVSSGGRRGRLYPVIAVSSSILGLGIGKYLTFVGFLLKELESKRGVQAVTNVSVLSGTLFDLFWLHLGSMLSLYDLMWFALAVVAAWSVGGLKSGRQGPHPAGNGGRLK